MKKIILKNDDATTNLGAALALQIKDSASDSIEIHLEGDLGAGKTFISRSIIKHCGWDDPVSYTHLRAHET